MRKNLSGLFILISLVSSLVCQGIAQQTTPYRLTLRDAIERGLRANLSVLVADTQVQEAEGTRTRRLSAALFPRVRFQSYANFQNRNLKAFGIAAPGFPSVVGPFSNYDFRVAADQNLLDLQSYRNYKASQESVEASQLNHQDARDLIIRSIAGLYLNAPSSDARANAAQTRVN